jgi:hypothetical protein
MQPGLLRHTRAGQGIMGFQISPRTIALILWSMTPKFCVLLDFLFPKIYCDLSLQSLHILLLGPPHSKPYEYQCLGI